MINATNCVEMQAAEAPRIRGYLMQLIMLISINVPTVSFGLAMGWVSLTSGEGGSSRSKAEDAALVGAAAATFAAGVVGVPLGAVALQAGRKPAVIATSAAFVVCWSLTLLGGWGVVAGRAVAGLAGAVAWCISPLLAREICSKSVSGAAVAAMVLAHNLGVLLMYCAADAGVPHRTMEYCCLGLSAAHCAMYLFAPESPPFLAANGKYKEARASLAWLRGVPPDHPSLAAEMEALPPPDKTMNSPFKLAREMLSDVRRRRAFIIALIAVVGQEACGVLSLLQFAERVFALARDEAPQIPLGTVRQVGLVGKIEKAGTVEAWATPARHAVMLGAVQLVASFIALYLVERVGRRRLLIWGALSTGTALAVGAAGMKLGWGVWAVRGALATAVAADCLGLQPAPYAILADMFHYQYRSCAVLLVMAATSVGNALETLVFPAVANVAGLWSALALAAALTLACAVFAILVVPETRGRTPEEIYNIIYPKYKEEALSDVINEKGTNSDYKSKQKPLSDINSLNSDVNGKLKNVTENKTAETVTGHCIAGDTTCIETGIVSLKNECFKRKTLTRLETSRSDIPNGKIKGYALEVATVNKTVHDSSCSERKTDERLDGKNTNKSQQAKKQNGLEANSDEIADVINSETISDVLNPSVVTVTILSTEQCCDKSEYTNI